MMRCIMYGLLAVLSIPTTAYSYSYYNFITFSGELTSVSGHGNWQAEWGQVEVGDTFSGALYYSFSDNTKSVPSVSYVYDPAYTIDLTIEYNLFFNSFAVESGYSAVSLTTGLTTDEFFLHDLMPQEIPNTSSYLDDVYLHFFDPTGESLDDSLLLPKSFDLFEYGSLTMFTAGPFDTQIDFSGSINEIRSKSYTNAPIPEPTTLFLIGTGLAGLAGTRFRKKKK